MKIWQLVGTAVPAMVATGALVFVVTPVPGAQAVTEDAADVEAPVLPIEKPSSSKQPSVPSTFVADEAVRVEARLGHVDTPRSERAETFVLVELKGTEAKRAATVPVHLGLVIDKSGSMQGKKFENAKASAKATLDRLADGDTLSLVAFDTKPETVVAPTVLDGSTRAVIARAIDGLTLGGDTCISCGIEAMTKLMDGSRAMTRRMVVLSDGEATAGLRLPDELRSLTRRSRSEGITVSGIGMALAYNERVLAAVAEGGEGQHRFVAQPSDLAAVFEAEASALRSTVAERVETRLTLEPGVELLEVVDRPFRRSGSDVVVDVGSLAANEVKTVLCKVRLPSAGTENVLSVASVSVRFRDLTTKDAAEVESHGTLGARAVERRGPADPFVMARVERATTAAVLDEANGLFRRGRVDEARRRIEAQHAALSGKAASMGDVDARNGRVADAKESMNAQLATLDRASKGFATPPPMATPVAPTTPGQPRPAPKPDVSNPFESNARQNQEDSFNSRR